MARSAKHSARRKVSFKDQPIDVNELAGMSNVEGMLSFLDRKPEEYARLFNSAETGQAPSLPQPVPLEEALATRSPAPNVGAPELHSSEQLPMASQSATGQHLERGSDSNPKYAFIFRTPDSGAPTVDAPNFDAAIIGAPKLTAGLVNLPVSECSDPPITPPVLNSGAVTSGAPTFGAPDLGDVFVYRVASPTVRPATTAQDAHTHGEQVLFATLWRLARPHPKGSFRAISIGERTLAKEVPMAYSTVQENLRSLKKKLAIEIRINGSRQPKTYIVYSYDEILRRRRTLGLTHVIRRTSGVFLINPSQSPRAPNLGAPDFTFSAPNPGAPQAELGAPNLRRSDAPDLGAHIRNKEILFPGMSSPSRNWPLSVKTLLEETGYGDDDAVQKMATAALQHAPDATDQELAHFIHEEAPRVLRNKTLDNPMGLLIRQVPRRFVGEGFRLYREGMRRQRDADAAARQEQFAEARQILACAAEHSELDVQWAQQLLGDGEGKES